MSENKGPSNWPVIWTGQSVGGRALKVSELPEGLLVEVTDELHGTQGFIADRDTAYSLGVALMHGQC